jgi:hypothetical protein
MTKRTLAVVFVLEALFFACLVFALLDRRAHERDVIFGWNQWGYRHDAYASREPGERRVAILGGSSAYEAGRSFGLTMAGQLFIELRQSGAPVRQAYSVVNLSQPRAGADTFIRTLRDYAYLDPDVVCIVDGYDTLMGTPPHGRDRSLVFRMTGYLPLLPARLLGRPGWLSDPDGGIADALRDDRGDRDAASCTAAPAAAYCAAIVDTARLALNDRRAVVIVLLPTVSRRHGLLQRSLAEWLARAYAGNPRVLTLDLGHTIELSNSVHSPDGIHRTDVGNHVVAQRIAQAIVVWPGAFARAD